MVQYDAKNEVASFDYMISWNVPVATEETISSRDAYEQVLVGNFEQYSPFNEGDHLHIADCSLSYAYDTKGFYRPVYLFSGYVNDVDNPWECRVPAA